MKFLIINGFIDNHIVNSYLKCVSTNMSFKTTNFPL